VDLNRRELVLVVFVDHSSQLGEVLADLCSTVPDYQVKFVEDLFEELIVAFDIFKQRLRGQHDLELLLGLYVGLLAGYL